MIDKIVNGVAPLPLMVIKGGSMTMKLALDVVMALVILSTLLILTLLVVHLAG